MQSVQLQNLLNQYQLGQLIRLLTSGLTAYLNLKNTIKSSVLLKKMSGKGKQAGQPVGTDYVVYYAEYLGQGAYGVIYKGYCRSRDCIVAIKKLKNDALQAWKNNPALKRQVEVMAKIKHPNVLRLFDAIEEPTGIYIITEYCDGGDLKKMLNKAKSKQLQQGTADPNRGPLSEALIFDIFCQIVSGMSEVNNQKCMHRDLKPENIMLNQDGTVKIADFGLAREVIGDDIFKLEKFSAKGTPIYAAPNVIRGQKFSALCDVWSCGLMVYELLAGKNYFETATSMYTLQGLQEEVKSKQMKISPAFNKFFIEILPKMVKFDEQGRISFSELDTYLKQHKMNILKSMDPNYKGFGQKGPLQPVAPQYQGNTYATNQHMGEAMPTAKKMSQKEVQEQNYHLILELFRYMDFVYNRGRLMIDLMNRLNSTTSYPLQNGPKYTLIFLQTSIFLSTIDQLINYLSGNKLVLPSNKAIVKSELDSKSRASLVNSLEEYINKLKLERASFAGMVQQIGSKLQSDSYKKRFPDLYAKYPQIYAALDDMLKNNKTQNVDFYQKLYRHFLEVEGRLREDESNEVILRIYYMCIFLARMSELIPDQMYNDKDAINRQRENFDKISKETLINNIQKYKFW